MEPTFFATPADFRNWLEQHHQTEKELLVGFYKVGSGKNSITWSESVDQALCYGWIDGIRKSRYEESYTIRFTPRKKTSIWSAVNIRKMDELIKSGLMHPAGLAAYQYRTEQRSKVYAYEKEPQTLNKNYDKIFRKNKVAWDFFNGQPPYYRKSMINWIMSAKMENTRLSRLEKLINASELSKRLQ